MGQDFVRREKCMGKVFNKGKVRPKAGRGIAILMGCCLGMTSVVLPSGDIFLKADLVSAADYAAEFYVSPDGDDSGSGSIDSPFRTLE